MADLTEQEKVIEQKSEQAQQTELPSQVKVPFSPQQIKDQEFEVQDLLIRSQLSPSEINFINLRIEGLTMEEITLEIGESSYKLRHSSKRKLDKYMTNINWLGDDDADKKESETGETQQTKTLDNAFTKP